MPCWLPLPVALRKFVIEPWSITKFSNEFELKFLKPSLAKRVPSRAGGIWISIWNGAYVLIKNHNQISRFQLNRKGPKIFQLEHITTNYSMLHWFFYCKIHSCKKKLNYLPKGRILKTQYIWVNRIWNGS